LTRFGTAPYDRVAVVCRKGAPSQDLRVKRFTAISLATCALAGCAGASQSRPESALGPSADDGGVVGRLQRRSAEQERRIVELEARIGLLEQEARSWRDAAAPVKPTQTVRIGARTSEPGADDVGTSTRAARGRVPVVRLHERDLAPAADEPLDLPAPPAGVAPRLAVVPLPAERAKALGSAAAPGVDGDAREQYRAALRALRDRRWDEALALLNRLLSEHPGRPLGQLATYWRGEVHYAQQRYREALIDFESVALQPDGGKAADALLKLGMCHRRLGDPISAERYFRQLREQHPSSDAARIASRENPS
jgi:tol-pal system protein YbgF